MRVEKCPAFQFSQKLCYVVPAGSAIKVSTSLVPNKLETWNITSSSDRQFAFKEGYFFNADLKIRALCHFFFYSTYYSKYEIPNNDHRWEARNFLRALVLHVLNILNITSSSYSFCFQWGWILQCILENWRASRAVLSSPFQRGSSLLIPVVSSKWKLISQKRFRRDAIKKIARYARCVIVLFDIPKIISFNNQCEYFLAN